MPHYDKNNYDKLHDIDRRFWKVKMSAIPSNEDMRNLISSEDTEAICKLIVTKENKITSELIRIRKEAYRYLGRKLTKCFFWIPWHDDFETYKNRIKRFNISGFNQDVTYYYIHNKTIR